MGFDNVEIQANERSGEAAGHDEPGLALVESQPATTPVETSTLAGRAA